MHYIFNQCFPVFHYIVDNKTFIINSSITSGIFQSILKHAKVKPLHKLGANNPLNTLRPISILPTLSKTINKWIRFI